MAEMMQFVELHELSKAAAITHTGSAILTAMMKELKMDVIEVSKRRYQELLDAEARLDALEAGGVDNWEGYDEAMRILEEGED